MKNRKASKQQIAEDRNALYRKVIIRNIELGKKNTELSHIVDDYKDRCRSYEKFINRKRWWQFWRYIYQISWIINETEMEVFDIGPKIATITYFYKIPIWKTITTIYY